MTKQFRLQYEDIASAADWRTTPAKLNPALMAISADSHVTEPPEAYSRYIAPAFRDIAPRIIKNPNSQNSELYQLEGIPPFPFMTTSAAGVRPKDIDLHHGTFADVYRASWDPKLRVEVQERDGILAEVLYPSIGMALCAHPDGVYKEACFRAYNQWIRDYCSESPKRLYAVGQSGANSVKETIEDLYSMKEYGLVGAMLPAETSCDIDYDHPDFDAVWKTAVELDLPISFHIFTGRSAGNVLNKTARAGGIAGFCGILRELQDITSMFILGGVFERNPDLKLLLVEADAGWVPHFVSRMDHAYKRHRYWLKARELQKLPSEYFYNNVYTTFQDDWVALQNLDMVNPHHIMWANDYPHADSTWPWSHELLTHHLKGVSQENIDRVLRENVKELYHLDVDTNVAPLEI
jgi:predicted TIM-barrel fold metal-dependent hydrolase